MKGNSGVYTSLVLDTYWLNNCGPETFPRLSRNRPQNRWHNLPRTQARSTGFESDWDFNFALGVMGRAKRKSRSPFPASFASTPNVPHCAIFFDGSCGRVFRFPHLRRLETRQWHNPTGSFLNDRSHVGFLWTRVQGDQAEVVLRAQRGSRSTYWNLSRWRLFQWKSWKDYVQRYQRNKLKYEVLSNETLDICEELICIN